MGSAENRAYALRRLKRRRVHIVGQPPGMTVDEATAYTLDIRGGLAPYTLAVVGGALPEGLDIDEATIAGTPTELGSASAFIQVTDAGGVTSQKQLNFAVVPA